MAFAGMEWIIIIIVVVLLLFGAKKVPEIARSFGKASGEFKRGKQMIEMEMREAERESLREASTAPRAPLTDIEPPAQKTGSGFEKAAIELGIDPVGRSDEELKLLIKDRVTGNA